jgi:hypothetical protein
MAATALVTNIYILLWEIRMFDVRSYAILLNKFFETGLDCEELTGRIREKLAAVNESVTPVDDSSSRLHLMLNGNKAMFTLPN